MKPFNSSFTRRNFLKTSGVAAVGLTFGSNAAFGAEKLNVYNWDTYIGDETLSNFSSTTGIEVQYDLYANLEEMYAKFQAGNPGYDVIVPSDYMLETMIAADMLVELDKSKLPNFKHVDPNFLNPSFDPGCKYNIPYFWGSVGLGYRKSVLGEVDSWSALFDNPDLAGRMAMLADSRFVMGVALLYLGYSANTINPDEIDAARDLLIETKKNLKGFVPDSGQDMLIAGDIDLVMEWNGDILKVMEEDDDLTYVIPKEGTVIWIDGLSIPKGAPNIENAYKFLNFIHEPKVKAEIANTIHYATTNSAAKEFISAEDLANPAIYASDEVVAKSQALSDVGDSLQLYDAAWTAIQAS
jgi:spermidine/putrescine transport system substrate-binding protein